MALNEVHVTEREVVLPTDAGNLVGDLAVPPRPTGLVIFAHGSGSSRRSPRNRAVAGALQGSGFATVLVDLLTGTEAREDEITRAYRFDIALLARRLVSAIDALAGGQVDVTLPVGCFGASTGAAAALIAAADRPRRVHAVVSRGGRPDLAGSALARVRAPTLLIVGGDDREVIALNRDALQYLTCVKRLEIVPGATHLFEEPGTMDHVIRLAADWFRRHLVTTAPES